MFNYFNSEKQHKKIHLKVGVKLIHKESEMKVVLAVLEEHISVSLVSPQHFSVLISKKII